MVGALKMFLMFHYRGNFHTRRERVADFTLLRRAELTLENGFQYFAIIDENSYTSHSTYTTPTRLHTTVRAYGSGNFAYGSATTTTTVRFMDETPGFLAIAGESNRQ